MHTDTLNRRTFLQRAGAMALGAGLAPVGSLLGAERRVPFMISLAEWSLHRTLQEKKLDPLDFPKAAKVDFGIDTIELSGAFLKAKIKDQAYLTELKKRADGLGSKILLVLVDGEGALGDPDPAKRKQAVESHYKWVDAAKFFNCHSLAVGIDTGGTGSAEEQMERAADGLRQLAAFAVKQGLNVIVENRGGLSSNGAWLAGTIKKVNLPNCGSMPDFGNFHIRDGEEYDRYQGVTELMPFAKAVSAQSREFDAQGNESHTDFARMLKIVLDAGYHGYVGIEYTGDRLSEPDGIRATKKLLEQIQTTVNLGG